MKTKKLPLALAAAIALAGFSACSGNNDTSEETNTSATETTTEYRTYTTREGETTVKPFVEAQTLIITEAPTSETTLQTEALPNETTVRQTEVPVSNVQQKWKDNALLSALPEPDAANVSSVNEFKSERGIRTVVRFDNFTYEDFLGFVNDLEAAGFKDNNNRYHIPEQAPQGTAMFYYSYDGNFSFGIYWRGSGSASGQGCELVICNYDQAQG